MDENRDPHLWRGGCLLPVGLSSVYPRSDGGMCQFARAAITKIPQTRWIKQEKFIFSRFWRLEVQDQGVGKVGFFGGPSL